MQWSGPNIQLQSCQYNKNEKTKLPGKTSWKIPIWLFICSGDLFQEKSNLQHCRSIFSKKHSFSWCSACLSLKILNQNVLNVFLQIFSVRFLHLTRVCTKKTERFDFNFWQHASLRFVFPGHTRFFLPIGDLAPYSKENKAMCNIIFSEIARYTNYCASYLA